ncbi:MAG: ASCH domain-containing protein [Planctomycetota bacterium]
MIHLPVIRREYLELILAGRKTAELRLTRSRGIPHGRVFSGERLYFKQSSGPVRATALVSSVEAFADLTPDLVGELAERTRETVRGRPAFFAERSDARYASVIHFERVEPCAYGPDFSRERAANPRAAWLILPEQADVYPDCVDRGLLTV